MNLIEEIIMEHGASASAPKLAFEPATVNLLVGPNNSGKSLFLKELGGLLGNGVIPVNSMVIDVCNLVVPDEDTRNHLLGKLEQEPTRDDVVGPDQKIIGRREVRSGPSEDQITQFLSGSEAFARKFCGHFLRHLTLTLDGSNRLAILGDAEKGDLLKQPQNILASLFKDDSKRAEVRRIVNDAFGKYFVIDPTHGSELRVRFSDVDPPADLERSFSDAAIKFHQAAEHIEQTSDGIRAFAGMVAAVIEGDPEIILLDEPEAFLHPALSTKLATALCKKARENDQQLFVATHSSSFLMGCVQAGVDLNIIRLTYRDGSATARLLDSSAILPLMRNPLLRSTKVLDGLFSESTIVTEGDPDRAFYDEINHRLGQYDPDRAIPNGLFLNAQNWQTTARIIEPLRALGVPAAAIVDIDVISSGDNTSFQNLLEAASIPESTRTGMGQLRGGIKKKIEDAGQKEDFKKQGRAVLSGAELQDVDNLISQCAEYGVFFVPVGELESWLSTLQADASVRKDAWLTDIFEKLGEDPSNSAYVKPGSGDVWDFIATVRAWLVDPARKGIPDVGA